MAVILVVGGLASGKRTFAQSLGYSAEEIVVDAHELVRAAESDDGLVEKLAVKAVVTCAEVGSGIVPLDAGERAWRERVGRMAAELALRADMVVRMVCGIPVLLKGDFPGRRAGVLGEGGGPTAARRGEADDSGPSCPPAQAAHPPRPEPQPGRRGGAAAARRGEADDSGPSCPPAQAALQPGQQGEPSGAIELILIRHGQTPGNGEKRYVGVVDQPLSEAGRKQARAAGPHADVERVYVSTLVRTHETAALMFPQAQQCIVEGIQEMDFGSFAGRTADEMVDDPAYRAWVDGGCEGRCPGGESQAELTDRVCASMCRLLCEASARGERRVVVVGHGGTMMGFLSRYGNDPSRRYWEWLVGNCEGYRIGLTCDVEGVKVESVDRWNA